MTKLERLREIYGVPAKRGGRIRFDLIKGYGTGTIVGATTGGSLRVHFDGDPKQQTYFIDPVLGVTYLEEQE